MPLPRPRAGALPQNRALPASSAAIPPAILQGRAGTLVVLLGVHAQSHGSSPHTPT